MQTVNHSRPTVGPTTRTRAFLVGSTLLLAGLGTVLSAMDLDAARASVLEQAEPADMLFYDTATFLEHVEAEGLISGSPPLILPAAAFSDSDNIEDDTWTFRETNGYAQGLGPLACLRAPVYLPDGAVIVNMFGYLYDDDDPWDATMFLYRKENASTAGPDLLATVSTTGALSFVQIPGDVTVEHNLVDNTRYSYYVASCLFEPEHRLYASWIFYTPPIDPITVSSATVVSDFGAAEVFVEESSLTEARRQMFTLENNGPPEFVLRDNSLGLTWKFGTRNQNFEINKGGSGLTEMTVKSNGDLQIAGTLSQGSSRTLKEGFEVVDPSDILERVAELPLVEWHYKSTTENDRHFGPMSEDFHAAFGLGDNPERLAPGDAAGIALAAIQALHAEKDEEIEALRAEIDELRERLEAAAR